MTPLYSVAPAPIGVAYYGLNNTTGTIQGTTVNTTSLAGTWSTTDPLGTAAELFDTSSGNAAGEFGAQLNTVLVNVTLDGQTTFGANSPNAPSACPSAGSYVALAGNVCPNEFWLQNYIEYSESTHSLTISNEIWNFSNPSANFYNGGNTLVGIGSVEDDEVYQGPSSGTIAVGPAPFSVVLYLNYTQGPCHLDSTPGTGVASCGKVSTTEPVNELFMNYTVRNSAGVRVCPTTLHAGAACGEDDDIFFNSVGPSNPTGVPAVGPNGRVGSATIQANGTAYDPLGLTNDFEFDYAIASDDGATNNIVYQNGIVGLGYCQNSSAAQSAGGGITCNAYSTTPAAVDFGGETGETSTGEVGYWAPQGSVSSSLIAPYTTGAATPVTHLETGPSLLIGLWNMTGGLYTGQSVSAPYTGDPAYTGGTALSYANIAPANAWLGIAQDQSPGVTVSSQFYFQVAPTFGFFSYWKGSGGAHSTTTLGSDLYLPSGWYTIEVLLSGYRPFVEQIDLTHFEDPVIKLVPDYSTGAYTPDWAFSNSDLANLSVSPSSTVPNGAGTSGSPYVISAPAPTVGTVTSISGGSVVLGEPGYLSWLFSGLNDYLFTVWIGAFINSTTAVTQFNPAPSFTMDYPTWQYGELSNGLWDLPTTDGFQYYLLNTQNLAVIGASDLYAWASEEATTIYEVVVNNGANDLIAGNHFNITNRGIDFTGGGTTDSATINGAPVAFQYDSVTRNVVWDNTFLPDPLSGPYTLNGLDEPFTAQDSLTLGESSDRVAANSFENASSSAVNATANAGATDATFWNVTCVTGYHPLAQETYPGSPNPGTGVCQPLSNSKTLDGYTMTGSADGASFQGGNFWYAYGNEPNPYGNIPFKSRLTSLTGTAEIATTTFPQWGDMAPLIPYSVSELTFKETGLPSSPTTTEFTMRLTNTMGGYTWLNTSATSATPASCAPSTVCVNFYVEFGTYTYVASPPSGYAAASGSVSFGTPSTLETIAFAPVLTPPAAPTVSATALDEDQALTVTGTIPTTGIAPYAWTWLISVNGGSYGAATQCAVNSGTGAAAGATVTCDIAGSTLTAADTYAFALQVTDSASTPATQTSPASSTVTVATMLTAPDAPSVSATALDADQTLTVTGTIPTTGTSPYAWEWLVSVNGGAYGATTQCMTNSGTGVASGATVTCAIPGGTLTGGDTYAFELAVTDSATVAETQTSTASSTVAVSSEFTAPPAPTVSATALDVNQALTVTGTIPTTGTAPYAWEWMVSVNGGSYVATTECATNAGTGAAAGATVTCAIPASTLTVGDTYAFELQVTDSAPQTQTSPASQTVTVATALTSPSTPTISKGALDANQALTVKAKLPSTGTLPYAWEWMVSVSGGSYVPATHCAVNSGSGASAGATETCSIAANGLSGGSYYNFELQATDSATSGAMTTSAASPTVTVASALTAPGAPAVGAPKLDVDQPLTVTGTVPSTGTAPYAWEWLVSVNGGSDVATTQCAVNSGTSASPGATETCSIAASTLTVGDHYTFKLRVGDSATTSETETSAASAKVTVSSALTSPAAPTVSTTSLVVTHALTVKGKIPSTGSSPYAWEWLISVNGGSYVPATQCTVNSGTGAAASHTETCTVPANKLTIGDTYSFELVVTDGATTPQTQTSAASATVTAKV
ncbi:MAG: thermopsin family protease [Thermoplasmata archaeon]